MEFLEFPVSWKLENLIPDFKKDRKKTLANYRPVSLTSVPGEMMDKVILDTTRSYGKQLRGSTVISFPGQVDICFNQLNFLLR